MKISEALKQRIAQLITANKVSTEADLLAKKHLELVVSPTFVAYANVRTVACIDDLDGREVTHLKFTPLEGEGLIVGQVAVKGEAGAVELSRGATRRTARFHFRAPLTGFTLEWSADRNLKLPVEVEEIPLEDGQVRRVLMIRVKTPATKPRVHRPRRRPKPPTGPS